MNTKSTHCSDCGKEVMITNAIRYGNGYICRACFDAQYCTCEHCGKTMHADDAYRLNRDTTHEQLLCNTCTGLYNRCNHCGEYFEDEYIWASDSSMDICRHCSDSYVLCDDCDQIVPVNEINYDENSGNSYCDSCYDEILSRECIEDYSYKPVPIFKGSCSDGLFLGVELEVDRGCNLVATAKQLYNTSDDIYLKHDGSLSSSGFEIVSHPATLDYHLHTLGWDRIMHICQENQYLSHDTSTCGLHIHMSRSYLGKDETEQDLNIAKLILLFDRWWKQYVIPFSRRRISEIERWSAKPCIECLHTDTEKEIVDKVKNYKDQGRYKAINLQNEDTIEFRMFRGTLNLNTFKASLQFVVAMTQFVKSIKLCDLFHTNWGDVFVCTEFAELKEYLKIRNIEGGR